MDIIMKDLYQYIGNVVQNANERFARLQNFLKINYNNKKVKVFNNERKNAKKKEIYSRKKKD